MLRPALDFCPAHGPHSHPAKRREQRVCPFFPQTAGRHTAGRTDGSLALNLPQQAQLDHMKSCLSDGSLFVFLPGLSQ